MITTTALTKHFDPVLAVDDVNLAVGAGCRYGAAGPQRFRQNHTHPSAPRADLRHQRRDRGHGPSVPRRLHEVLPTVGALVEGTAAYGHLSGRTNLALLDASGPGGSRRSRRTRIAAALERVGLAGVDNRPVKAYSLGMRQRLGLDSRPCCSCSTSPPTALTRKGSGRSAICYAS